MATSENEREERVQEYVRHYGNVRDLAVVFVEYEIASVKQIDKLRAEIRRLEAAQKPAAKPAPKVGECGHVVHPGSKSCDHGCGGT